jgi:hypothetical protein
MATLSYDSSSTLNCGETDATGTVSGRDVVSNVTGFFLCRHGNAAGPAATSADQQPSLLQQHPAKEQEDKEERA